MPSNLWGAQTEMGSVQGMVCAETSRNKFWEAAGCMSVGPREREHLLVS